MKKEKYLNKLNLEDVSSKLLEQINHQVHNDKLTFSTQNSALLILDMQKYFTSKNSKAFLPSAPEIIPRINNLIDYFHFNNLIVIFTKHIDKDESENMMIKWWKGKIEKKNPFSNLDNNISFYKSLVIEKNSYDAFYQNDLCNILEKHKIKQLVVTGIITHLCVETTIRSAFVRNYEVILPVDCTADYNFEIEKNSLINLAHGFCQLSLSKNLML